VEQKKGIKTFWAGKFSPTYHNTFPFDDMRLGEEVRFGGMIAGARHLEKGVDVFHVHTHYTDIDVLEDTLRLSKPVVWNCHDEPLGGFNSLPQSRLAPVERLGTVYRTYCPKDWFPAPSPPNHGLVITTGLSDVPGHERYWVEAFREMTEQNLEPRCYTFSRLTPEYFEVADIRNPIDVRLMIEQLSKATAGICGSPSKGNKNMKSAYPNKLFEYVAAGIPVICIGSHHDMAKTINNYDLGVVIDDVKDIKRATQECIRLRDHVARIRGAFTMESQIDVVLKEYNRVCL
jgi:hypothetical protein